MLGVVLTDIETGDVSEFVSRRSDHVLLLFDPDDSMHCGVLMLALFYRSIWPPPKNELRTVPDRRHL